jgi:alanyl-tRNA synthetase
MGFERICAVLAGMAQGKVGQISNYDTDVFTPIFKAIQKRTSAPDYQRTLPQSEPGASATGPTATSEPRTQVRGGSAPAVDNTQVMIDVAYRVIADHLRCLTFAITDGAIPDRENRGYVLRRILRRAVRYGWQYLNVHEPFLCDLVEPLIKHMGDAFPELRTAHNGKNVQHVVEILRDEEESFGRTLERGIKLFEEAADEATRYHHGRISGEAAFKLHDTYGFPIDLTELMAEERDLTVNIGEYERLMEEARVKARSAQKRVHPSLGETIDRETTFVGYDQLTAHSAIVVETLAGDGLSTSRSELSAGEYGALVLASTSFYAEQGGQVGDRGRVVAATGAWEFSVEDTQKVGDAHVHIGKCIRGEIRPKASTVGFHMPSVGEIQLPESVDTAACIATAIVDPAWRVPTMSNHTATHLLNWALRDQLGRGVQQKGSLVDPEKTRFDFSHNKPLSDDELRRIEELVVQRISANLTVHTKEVEQQSARKINTLRAVFGEKYPDVVRVVSIGADIDAMLADPQNPNWMNYSVEFCGGTHVKNTAEIEAFALVSEEGVAKRIRRVVGISGEKAKKAIAEGDRLLAEARGLLKNARHATELADLQSRQADLQRRLTEVQIPIRHRREIQTVLADVQAAIKEQSKQAAAESGGAVMERVAAMLQEAPTTGAVTVVVGEVPSASADSLRSAVDWIRQKTAASAVLLATANDAKVTLIAGMSKDAVTKGLKAGDLIKEIAPHVGGRGGGRPDMAQGGGTDPAGIPAAIHAAKQWLTAKLA